ncbi:glutathione S-transferase family protein [Lysobacter silvisoli]|uniref:Glutathione S-transferase family protein n=1 Tax=Lysobacter silvisoli TaxID=2293254 RepID=A0A371K0F8_9GAMM|nr:glutathione S-transferase family protein [Lysobacter silvisoli]RDZ27413.1 glutathione S-transferase family protein [Lysobacter silvisoli]
MNPLPILYYGVPSGCSFGSIVALEWLGQPYQLSRIEMPEEVTADEFRRINPVAETPALMDEQGRVLTESMAILNHIAARGVGRIGYAQGTPEFDRLNRTLAYLNTSFFNAFAPLWHALEHPSADDAALKRYGRDKVEKVHAQLEAMIGDGPWLLGEQRTVADAYFIGIARWSQYHDVVDRSAYPKLQRLFEALEADPAVKFAHAIEDKTPALSAGGFRGEIKLADTLPRLLQAA